MSHTKNTAADSAILISKKAYNDFARRIRDIFTDKLNAPSVTAEAMNALDRYVRGEEIAFDKMDRIVLIAFLMIQPEIDKAIARSKAARLRAAIRKMKKGTETYLPTAVPADADVSSTALADKNTATPADADNLTAATESEEEIPVMMNRRARREYEREMRRELKREQRRKLRENMGLTTGHLLRRG